MSANLRHILLLDAARTALEAAHQDLAEWRQFARYNVRGEVCGEFVGIPDPPQRPTPAALDATGRVMAQIEKVLGLMADRPPGKEAKK
jgi:hypothetical protein